MTKYSPTGPFVANTTPYYNTAAFFNGIEDGINVAQTQVSDVNPQTGTTYTLVLADAGKTVEMNNAAGNTLTIPPNASVAFSNNTLIEVHQTGAGVTSVAAGAGVTLNPVNPIAVPGQWKTLRLRKRATNTWVAEMIGAQVTGGGEFVNLARDYGVASGQDITTVLQTVAALTTPRTVYLPAGSYTISDLVNFTRPVDLVGDGPNATIIRKTAAAGQLRWSGTRGSNITVSANVASGAGTLTLSSTSTLVAGDFLNLHDNTTWPWSTAGATHGEIVRVKTVDSGTVVTLYSPTVDAYTTAQSAAANKLTFVSGGSIQRMTINQTSVLTTNTDLGFIRVLYARGFEARDIVGIGHDQFVISFDSCLEGLALHVNSQDSFWDTTTGYYGYGVLMRGCTQQVVVQSCFSRGSQVVNGGGDTTGGPRYIKVADCVATEGPQWIGDPATYQPLFGTHGDCMQWEFSDCVGYSTRGTAFEIKGSDHVISNFFAHNIATTGVFAQPESSRLTFINPKIQDINGTGLIITQDSTVIGGRIEDCDSRGLRVDGSGCTVIGTEVRNAGRTSSRDAFYLNTGANNTVLRDITAREMPTATSYVINGVASLTGVVIHMPRRVNVQSGANANVSAAVYTGGTAYTL
jgi:hypothetical protein